MWIVRIQNYIADKISKAIGYDDWHSYFTITYPKFGENLALIDLPAVTKLKIKKLTQTIGALKRQLLTH